MQTNFSIAQLADPDIATADKILRACVHCGFCQATCPTYVLLGDELDSPRGRIYLIKEMLEQNAPATAEVVTHIDRCLSCLSCMTTCPSGVHYMHLVDHARSYIDQTYERPWNDRLVRKVVSSSLQSLGYQIVEAVSGSDAVDIYRARHADIRAVVLDMVMQGMTGRATYLALRDIERNVAVLLMSGHTLNEQVQEILDLGVRGFVSKPYSIAVLAAAMVDLTRD